MGRLVYRRAGPVGIALTAWDIWRRIPKQYRRAIIRQARVYGPLAAKAAIDYQRRRRRK